MLVVPCVFYPFLEFNVLLVCGVVSDRHLMDVGGREEKPLFLFSSRKLASVRVYVSSAIVHQFSSILC